MSQRSNNKGASDNPSSAPEEGDVQTSGRNRGQVVEPARNQEVDDESENKTGEQFESGRQDAAPRTGGA